MLEQGAKLDQRNLIQEPPSAAELDKLIGDRNYRDFLNPKHELYRKLRRRERLPSRAQALKLMAEDPNLIRRPIVVRGGSIVLGFNEQALKKLAS